MGDEQSEPRSSHCRCAVEACVGSSALERVETTRRKLGSRKLRVLGDQRRDGWESISVDGKRPKDQRKEVELDEHEPEWDPE